MKKDSEKYKEHIKSEFERLFNSSEVIEEVKNKQPYFHFFMFSNYGLEYFNVVQKTEEISMQEINNLKLRCRFNSARNLELYGFKCDEVISEKKIKKSFLKREGVIKLT